MRFYVVDSFAKKPFTGNPAAVVFVDRELHEDDYLNFSGEFNLSETCFVGSASSDFEKDSDFELRFDKFNFFLYFNEYFPTDGSLQPMRLTFVVTERWLQWLHSCIMETKTSIFVFEL